MGIVPVRGTDYRMRSEGMKTKVLGFLALVLLMAAGCNNFYHDLLPSDDDRIKSFSVDGQVGVEIGDDTIFVTVSPNTNISALVPSIQVDSGATVFPVTYEYVSRAFADENPFGAAVELYAGGNMGARLKDMIRSNIDIFAVPVLDLPINFNHPVDFLVVSAIGTTRQYTVMIEVDTGEGKFNSFSFDKFFNPEMVRSASGSVNLTAKTVTVNVSYPEEYTASYKLTPSFATNGARVYLDGRELRSSETLIDFSTDLTSPGSVSKTLTLKRAGFDDDTVWTLIVNFSEDPDTSRAIIDFRFKKSFNPLINADYMAEIVNNGDTGTINVTVYYSGAKPDELRASLILPGTVRVNGEQQISEYSRQDFSAPVQYIVTSRILGRVRTYTVNVNLVSASDPLPQITYFGFNKSQNPQLLSDSTAMIDHAGRYILIEAVYDSDHNPPASLIPSFNATGTVTVNNAPQTSGTNPMNLTIPAGYVVTNPSNPTLRREYRVEVRLVMGFSSEVEIFTFGFYRVDNPGLIADVNATIDQTTGAISATLLFEAYEGNRTLAPRWTNQGKVEVGGERQTSGVSRQQFSTPQSYIAVANDGITQKNYTVTIREINCRIYVKSNATGRNDGTNWENAYVNISDASRDAGLLPAAIQKEIWIAAGTYNITSTIPIYPNLSFIGGFVGNEASISARSNPAGNRPVLSGSSNSVTIFGDNTSSGVYSFQDMVFTNARNSINIWYNMSSSTNPLTVIIKGIDFIDHGVMTMVYDLTVTDCSFTGSSGLYVAGGNIATINNCQFTNTSRSNNDGGGGGGIWIQHAHATVTNCTFTNTTTSNRLRGNAIFYDSCQSVTQSGNSFNSVPSPQVTTQ
jgi:hypothetical protein